MSSGFHLGSDEHKPEVSIARIRLYHMISDEELSMVARPDDLPMAQVFWAALGIMGGSMQATVATLGTIGQKVMTAGDVAAVAVTAAAGAVTVVAGIEARRRKVATQALQLRIRQRDRLPVQGVPDLDLVPWSNPKAGGDPDMTLDMGGDKR